jgi:hypothetical protein
MFAPKLLRWLAIIVTLCLGYYWQGYIATDVPTQTPAMPQPHIKTAAKPAQFSSLPETTAISSVSVSSASSSENPPHNLTFDEALTAVRTVETEVYDRAYQMFDQEPVDFDWAPAYEKSLRQMFYDSKGLDRVSLSQVYCRTTLCQIVVYTPQSTDADYFTAMVYNALEKYQDGALKGETAIARNMEKGRTSLYIARKGHTIGFY